MLINLTITMFKTTNTSILILTRKYLDSVVYCDLTAEYLTRAHILFHVWHALHFDKLFRVHFNSGLYFTFDQLSDQRSRPTSMFWSSHHQDENNDVNMHYVCT